MKVIVALIALTAATLACTLSGAPPTPVIAYEVVVEHATPAGYTAPTPLPTIDAAAYYGNREVYVPVVTPVAVEFGNVAYLEEDGRYFTDDVLRWSEHIRRWSVQYGIDEYEIAILMQVGSCGDPNFVDMEALRFGLFAAAPKYYDSREVNLLDVEVAAEAALTTFHGISYGTGGVNAYAAYFDGRHIQAGGGPFTRSDLSQAAYAMWMKGRTGSQVCLGRESDGE